MAEFQTLAAAVHAALPTPDAKPSLQQTLDWGQVRAIAVRLETLLADDDLISAAVFSEHQSLLTAAFGDAAATLGRAIESFDFDQALSTLRCAMAASPAVEPLP